MKYWAYLHSNGTIQLKRWFGDHKDYTEDCRGNPFVQKVVPPFDALNEDDAEHYATRILKPNGSTPDVMVEDEGNITHQFRFGK